MYQLFNLLILFFACCEVFGEKCTNAAPFLKYLKYGYDLAEFDIYGCPYIGGRRAAIADYSDCDKGEKYMIDVDANLEYEVPDGFYRVSYAGFSSASSGNRDTSFDDFIEQHIERRVFNVFSSRIRDLEKYYFRKSEYYRYIRKLFDNGNSVGIVPYYVSTTSAAANPLEYEWNRKFISHEFLKDANALPNNFTGNEDKFLEFVEKYGTHYITTANFGGIIHRITTLKNSLSNAEKTDLFWEVRKDAYILDKNVEVKCEKMNGSRRIQKVFDSKQNFMQIMLGGFADRNLFTNRSIPVHLTRKNPSLVSAEMQPIVVLLSKEEKEKRDSLAKAIKIHLIRSTNEAYVNIINDYATKVTPEQFTTKTLNKYQQRKDSYDETELIQLGEEINEALHRIARKMH